MVLGKNRRNFKECQEFLWFKWLNFRLTRDFILYLKNHLPQIKYLWLALTRKKKSTTLLYYFKPSPIQRLNCHESLKSRFMQIILQNYAQSCVYRRTQIERQLLIAIKLWENLFWILQFYFCFTSNKSGKREK